MLRLIRGRYGPAVELCDIGASGLRLLDYLREQALLIVIDACLMNRAPGEILVQEPDLDVPLANSTSLHQIGPLDTLSLAKHLYAQNMPHRVLFIMVETRDIDAATEKKACREVLGILDREIGACFSRNSWRGQRPQPKNRLRDFRIANEKDSLAS
uniref:Hydrogenase maturation protease n=1 Tax=Candidatus Kentrum sp. TC TaxID=2126339 RepID=A0A451A611_9GAMM|nr:MAG: hydrogenase maturation protease [Candidatus Kentron sp. TC]